jgi:hypothetical protein
MGKAEKDFSTMKLAAGELEHVPIVLVDADGDTYIGVCVEAGERRPQVPSKVLSLASPVFRKLFSSGFRERTIHHDGERPALIPLSDDPLRSSGRTM